MPIEATPVVRKTVHLTENEVKILDAAVETGIATTAMEAIHIAIDLIKGHVEMKKAKERLG